ncbi:hypothetical protein BDZ94DRAFT_1263869 [Collybia nuda]|uniref:Uncharacterized protein n=1 Tax=Collybia nuda TaxID=64659 RepID=A0A9P5Y324_9AGAR|nr:hypothetical protein BDZ94DRAFT_1263869 [Collybia nuda]
MAPYYGPEDPTTQNIERYFLAGNFICGVGYGVQLVLYVTCAIHLWTHRKSMYLFAYITTLIVLETIWVSAAANTVQINWIDNRNYPGGPWQYFLDTQALPVNVMFYAFLFVMTFLSDILVLWRCWVIWRASGTALLASLVLAFPVITLVGSFIMGTFWTLQSTQPGLSLYSAQPLAFGTSYYTISLAVNILLTILIIGRLVVYRKRIVRTLPEEHAKHYISMMTIVVESAALYSIFALVFLITYATGHPANQILLATETACQQIAGYLIIYRVADGRAWDKATMTSLPEMEFNNNPGDVKKHRRSDAQVTHISTFQITSTGGPTNDSDSINRSTKEEVNRVAEVV